MSASTARHETRALLRAHLAAASGYRHLTRHCPICHRLLRLALEPAAAPGASGAFLGPSGPSESPESPESPEAPDRGAAAADGPPAPPRAGEGSEDESPATT
ncbi:DUF6274 family protein [Streptomyces sp. NPDC048560]|uniref:DUF6274 family protein n=1 Tax=Streptomyces sp. NPDC048560 TaxID=3155488 RepID=UPI0034391900